MPKTNKNNGSRYFTLNSLVDRFYTSRFNRDNKHGLSEGEDIDNSKIHRIYNKGDVKDLLHSFFDFFEWVINAENISKVYLTRNLLLERESKMPTVRRANIVDELRSPNRAKAGELYVTRGKYIWTLWLSGDAYEKMRELQHKDPEYMAKYAELQKSVDERNANDKKNKGNEPAS